MHHLFSISIKQTSQQTAQNIFRILKQKMSSRSNAVAVGRHWTAVMLLRAYWDVNNSCCGTSVGQWVTQHPDHQTHQARKHTILFPNKMWCTITHLHCLSTQQNTTIGSLATAHFLPVAFLTTIFHCWLLWCTSYKQSSRTHFQNLVLSHYHSNMNIKFCNTGRSVGHYNDSMNLMTPVAIAKWRVTLVLHNNHNHTDVCDQVAGTALCFVSLLYHFHSLPFHAPAPLWVISQWWALYCSPIMTPIRTPPTVTPSLSHIFILVHHLSVHWVTPCLYIPTSQHPLAFFMVPEPGKAKVMVSPETSATTHYVTQCHIQEDLNPPWHNCINLRTHNLLSHYFMVTSGHRKRQLGEGTITEHTEGH